MGKLRAIAAAAIAVVVATEAGAGEIGFSSPDFDDNFQTVLREAARTHAESLEHAIEFITSALRRAAA